MSEPIYLYRIEWDDVLPEERILRDPLIAGGCHNARDARRLMAFAMGSRDFRKIKHVRGTPVILSVRRLGPDTPATRDRLGVLGPRRGRQHYRASAVAR
jgi:hypothetical protein